MLELYPHILGEPTERPCLQWGTTPVRGLLVLGKRRLEGGEPAGKTAEVCGAGQNWGLSDSECRFGTYWL